MITNILILLLVVTVIAVVVSIVGNSKEVPQDVKITLVDNHKEDTTERIEDSLGTLSDRAVAALQYQRMQNSFKENCERDPEAAEMVTNQVRDNFDHMAKCLATIGTNIKPEDVPTSTDGVIPPGWTLEPITIEI